MNNESLSPLLRGILEILLQKTAEDEAQRQLLATQSGLPTESTWRQIGDEARRQKTLDLREVIDGLRQHNPDLAERVERCFNDGLTLLQHLSDSPEDDLARFAASRFLVDYKDLYNYCLFLTAPEAFRSLLDNTWMLYENYGRLQNQFNNAGYILDRNQAMRV